MKTDLQGTKDGKKALIEQLGFRRFFKGESWQDLNREMFDFVSEKYDATNILHSLGTKGLMDDFAVKNLKIKSNAKILDLCAGTCDISIRIAKMYPDSHIIALDASDKMLNIGKEKLIKQQITNVETVLGDALSLPFEDQSFDYVVISFGLRNLLDIQAGLLEMKRVLKLGGVMSNIDQGKPQNPFIKAFYKIYFYRIAPLIGKLLFHIGEFNTFRYLPESNNYFPDQVALSALFTEIGLEDVRNHDFLFGAVAQQVGRKLR